MIQVTFSCQEGQVMVGNGTITCQIEGVWSGQLPECQFVYSEESSSKNRAFFGMALTGIGTMVGFFGCAYYLLNLSPNQIYGTV